MLTNPTIGDRIVTQADGGRRREVIQEIPVQEKENANKSQKQEFQHGCMRGNRLFVLVCQLFPCKKHDVLGGRSFPRRWW